MPPFYSQAPHRSGRRHIYTAIINARSCDRVSHIVTYLSTNYGSDDFTHPQLTELTNREQKHTWGDTEEHIENRSKEERERQTLSVDSDGIKTSQRRGLGARASHVAAARASGVLAYNHVDQTSP